MENIRYKDSFFTSLFSDPPRLRELYGAISGRPLPKDAELEVNTLENVLFMGRLNDLSFLAGSLVLVLLEHQSTVNPNMPLRFLLYLGRVYEKVVESRGLYRGRRMEVPRPEFYVLYNGREELPDETELRLSELWSGDGSDLELRVKVLNINWGHNREIMEKSPSLAGYARFVARVRDKEGSLGREGALKEAVRYSIREGILREYLREHGREVENMLLTEWDWDEAKEVWKEEGREEGREEGWTALADLIKGGKSLEEALVLLKTPGP